MGRCVRACSFGKRLDLADSVTVGGRVYESKPHRPLERRCLADALLESAHGETTLPPWAQAFVRCLGRGRNRIGAVLNSTPTMRSWELLSARLDDEHERRSTSVHVGSCHGHVMDMSWSVAKQPNTTRHSQLVFRGTLPNIYGAYVHH